MDIERLPFESGSTTPDQQPKNRVPPHDTSNNSIDSELTKFDDLIAQQKISPGTPADATPYSPDVEKGIIVSERENAGHARNPDPNLVDWDGPADQENPMNWGVTKKWYITMMMSTMTFCITFSSSVFSQATLVTAQEFEVSTDVTTLATSLVVLVRV